MHRRRPARCHSADRCRGSRSRLAASSASEPTWPAECSQGRRRSASPRARTDCPAGADCVRIALDSPDSRPPREAALSRSLAQSPRIRPDCWPVCRSADGAMGSQLSSMIAGSGDRHPACRADDANDARPARSGAGCCSPDWTSRPISVAADCD